MPKLQELTLPTQLKDRLVQGHPWVYRDRLGTDVRLRSGAWVRLRCGGWTGFGLWDDKGPIALRIFSQKQLPDARWLRDRVREAWELREPLRAQGCTAYRWLFGEGDGLPGLTVDLYGEFAVVQTYMAVSTVLLGWLTEALRAIAPLQGILLRTQHGDVDSEREPSATPRKTQLLWGIDPPDDLAVTEHGLRFQVNLHAGQKTGLFLDHRENRRFVETICRDRHVLNCFAYTGAFSLYALRGGAAHVTSIDIGKGLATAAEANLRLNHLARDRHTFVTADCFEALHRYAQAGKTFDTVILDPPSFAKSKQNRFAAVRAYTKLNALALKCVAPRGTLVSASCTSQVSPVDFQNMLAASAASSDRLLQIVHEAGQPLDHPVPAGFPEGRYLKFVVARVCDRA